MCDEERAFRAALDAEPGDETARLVFADWLDDRDRGEEAARQRRMAPGYRALVLLKRVSRVIDYYDRDVGRNAVMHCFAHVDVGAEEQNRSCVLPWDWFEAMRPPADLYQREPEFWHDYRSALEATDAAALAFADLPPERQRELLAEGVRA